MSTTSTRPLRQTFAPARRALRLLAPAALLAAVSAPSGNAEASVFRGAVRWAQSPAGYTVIPVCIEADSSAKQKGDGADAGLIHAPNPSLSEVVTHVRGALSRTWESDSSVRFVGWKTCTLLSSAERDAAIGIYIHPDASNSSIVGKGSVGSHGVRFKPWGNQFNRCIDYDWGTTHVEYSFDCVEQYAIHEIGHALGFVHEWEHPLTSAACTADNPGDDPVQNYSWSFDVGATYAEGQYFVASPLFDRHSIMNYGSVCADKVGVRFGTETLSPTDRLGLESVYPAAPVGAHDVGVLQGTQGCGGGEPIHVYMDDEDDGNQDATHGWTGASGVDHNSHLSFCRVNGDDFKKIQATPGSARSADYAVLRLGAACPAGSVAFSRTLDNEDAHNQSYVEGDLFPGEQNEDGKTSTTLELCLFRPENAGATMTSFPDLGFDYGVIAPSVFNKAVATGWLHTDDEDSGNANALWLSDPTLVFSVTSMLELGADTTFHLARVR